MSIREDRPNRRRLIPYAGAETRHRRITRFTADNLTTEPYAPKRFFTVTQAAKFAQCSTQTIRNICYRHPIATIVLGKILVSRAGLESVIANEANDTCSEIY